MSSAVIIVAAGSSTRLGTGRKKEYIQLKGKPVIHHTFEAFASSRLFRYICMVVPPSGIEEARRIMGPLAAELEVTFAEGGATRQQSVLQGLRALEPAAPDYVLIHDGARPWVSVECIAGILEATAERGACAPAVVPPDAIKRIAGDGVITEHFSRNNTLGIQTPQGFSFPEILLAHEKAAADGETYIDDTEIFSRYIHPVYTLPGESANRKITYLHDINAGVFRIGQGYDIHRLTAGSNMVLGGAAIPSDMGEEAHSDGDVLLHAVIDALFGAAAAGDIGTHFPPEDRQYKDISSRELLRRTASVLKEKGYVVVNIDATVILEQPKIRPYIPEMRKNIGEDLGIRPDCVSVKGKTAEKTGPVGKGEAVEAQAVCLIQNR